MSTVIAHQPALIQALLSPSAYPDAGPSVELVETHISWVLLAGACAYKIKKPVNLGFLDFTTLPLRLHFCREELRLNSRLAADLYLEVVPITGTPEAPRVEGPGAPIEYAVKMVRFKQEEMLCRQLEEGRLRPWQIDRLAVLTADFHAGAAAAGPDDPHGTPMLTHQPALENFEVLQTLIKDPQRLQRLQALRAWTEQEYQRLEPVMHDRKLQGFVKECHGDLHLGNVTQIGDRIVAFDGIEFNDSFRWIDVMSELAFLFTDLEHRGRRDLAWRALNRYLEATGDYPGLALLRYYNLYRIMVRAKVDALRLGQSGLEQQERDALEQDLDRYLDQAEGAVQPGIRALVLTRGPSGSGKTYLSQTLLQAMGAVRVRSDVERKRLFGLPAQARTGSAVGEGLYDKEASRQTFALMLETVKQVLRAGFPAIVDASFLDPQVLQPFAQLAQEQELPLRILDLRCPDPILRQRLATRAADPQEASEAGQEVLAAQLAAYQPLAHPCCRPIASDREWTAGELLAQLDFERQPFV